MSEIKPEVTQSSEYTKNFDGWNELAKKLDNLKSPLYNKVNKNYNFKPREIWFCSVGANIGSEICGKNDFFERPVLIINKTHRTFTCFALTSQKPKYENLYFDISYTDTNDQVVESYILLSSLITLDVNRLQRKLRKLSEEKVNQIFHKFVSNVQKTISPKLLGESQVPYDNIH